MLYTTVVSNFALSKSYNGFISLLHL